MRLEQWDLPWTTHICCHQVHLWTLDSPAAFKMAVLPREPHLPMGAIWLGLCKLYCHGFNFVGLPACLSYLLGPWSQLQLPGNRDAVTWLGLSSFLLPFWKQLLWTDKCLQGFQCHGTGYFPPLRNLRVTTNKRAQQISFTIPSCSVMWVGMLRPT